jgi:hypothetical protein
LPAQMPVGQLKIWPINIKWHLQLLTNIETYSRPRFIIYAAFVWNSCLGMSVKLIPTAARPTGCRNSRQSQRDDGPLFRLFHNQTDMRFFVKHFSSVFFFFSGPENVNVCKCERLLNTASISEWKEKESGSRAYRRPPTQKHSKQNENYTNGKKVWNYFKSERNIIWSNRTRNVFRCFGSYINGPWL